MFLLRYAAEESDKYKPVLFVVGATLAIVYFCLLVLCVIRYVVNVVDYSQL